MQDKFGAVLDDFQEMFGAVNSAVYSVLVDFRLNLWLVIVLEPSRYVWEFV